MPNTTEMHRFFVDKLDIGDEKISIKDRDDIKHITKVLRLMPGSIVEISDSAKFEYKAEILTLLPDEIDLLILDKQGFAREPNLKVDLFQGVPKQGRMEVIIQKSVELGINSIVPLFTKRTVVTDNGDFDKKIIRWQKISDEAVKQCKRGLIPKVTGPVTFGKMMKLLSEYDLVLFLYENEDQQTIKQVLRALTKTPETVAIIIGPEGGFSDEEACQLKASGASVATLGKTILRTETAGAAAIAVIMYEFELD